MAKYRYMADVDDEGAFVVAEDLKANTYGWNSYRKTWVYDGDLAEYFIGLNTDLDYITEEEAMKITGGVSPDSVNKNIKK